MRINPANRTMQILFRNLALLSILRINLRIVPGLVNRLRTILFFSWLRQLTTSPRIIPPDTEHPPEQPSEQPVSILKQ
jgi:hypothetical protein